MKRIICDECRIEVAPDTYGLSPHGWLRVDTRGLLTDSEDFCSPVCAVKALEKRVPVAAAAGTPVAVQ